MRRSRFLRRRFPRLAAALVVAASVVAWAAPGAQAYEDPYDTPLSLVNGWTGAPFSTHQPGVKQAADGIVEFTGAIAGGNPGLAFTLPVNDRPATNVYVPVDTYGATKGRLLIQQNGQVFVQSEGAFSNASQFTSLDGVSFALPSSGYSVPVALANGWQHSPFGTGTPAVQLETVSWFNSPAAVSVHFSGAVSSNAGPSGSSLAFTLPPGYRPATTMYVPVDMANATNGRLIVTPGGSVYVQAESSFANAQEFTSLDGAWFVLTPGPPTAKLNLVNGWTAYGGGTAAPAVDLRDASTVEFTGAISTTSTNSLAFTLPSGWAPPTVVYVAVDMCDATNGRLIITTSGDVYVQAEKSFSNASCFTSLDGASFSLWETAPS